MAWQVAAYKLTSVCQMICHNGQTADPLNRWAKAIKAVSSKRTKTDADYEEMSRLEFMAGLYINKDGPVIPAANIDAMVINAAKKEKEGGTAKIGVFCLGAMPLEYDGPRTADELWKDGRFRHVAIVRVGTARVARTRPVFENWQGTVRLNYEDSVVNIEQLDRWLFIAGTQIGQGDWRPQNGRFTVVRIP